MKKAKLLAVAIVLVLSVSLCLVACNKPVDRTQWLADAVERDDNTSVYDKIGATATIADVTVNSNGDATITKDGITYTLGLDFLSMAMVYNCRVPSSGEWASKTKEDIYNEWWKLYIQRWNKMVPQVPLYSNQYYDIYASKIGQFETSPYWGAADAVVGATSTDGKIIIGNTTDLSGSFRVPAFGKNSPGAADLDISNLITGYSTVVASIGGAYSWNDDVVAAHEEKINSDGTLTYTVTIKDGLKMSDGSEITVDNYLAAALVGETPVYGAAGGSATPSPTLMGAEAFAAFDGTNGDKEGVSRYLSGLKKLSDKQFSVTINKDYADYYYAVTYAAFSPSDVDLFLCGAEIIVDADTKAVGLSNAFYETETKNDVKSYKNAAKLAGNIKTGVKSGTTQFAFSGPYMLKSFDNSTKTAVLEKNTQYVTETYRKYHDSEGNAHDGNITEITYVKIISETQTDQLKKGEVNVLAGITGGDDTKAALALTTDGSFRETHYDRAGYGMLGLKGDYGPTQFVEVRQAIMYTINRVNFADTFTGGYGSVVHGPYYKGADAYKANESVLNSSLNQYNFSKDKAIELLEAGGWIYDANGNEYKSGVRYKKLEGYELSKANLQYVSTDNKYGTVRIEKDGVASYYLPLVINWSGTQSNNVTDMLETSWAKSTTVQEIGMYVTLTTGEFEAVVYGDYYQMEEAGYNRGDHPNVSCANWATGFTSAIYDMSYNWNINDYYEDYNMSLMDPADFWADYQNK